MKFIVDMMFGCLVRWFCFYGYDIFYGIVEDEVIIRKVFEDDRIIFICDFGFVERVRIVGVRVFFLFFLNFFEG